MLALLQSTLPLPVRRGKVRDVYDLGDKLLIIATDRISAFDVIMPSGIPDKGKILTALSLFWFKHFPQFENHLIADFPDQISISSTLNSQLPTLSSQLLPFADQLIGRSMLVRKTSVIPIECVARGYLAGSGWKEYQQSQTVCGVALPPGLKQCAKLPTPIFTPATKEESGHDINISFADAAARVGQETAAALRDRTLALYAAAAEYAAARGVIIADTKFEFGRLPDGKLILIDEVLTPDSSRFWPAAEYQPGQDQPSYDKQFVRNYLETLNWNKTPPGPKLPEEVITKTREKYMEAYEKLVVSC